MDFSLQVFIVVVALWTNEISPAPRQKRLTLFSQMPSYYFTNIDGHPGTYSFGYDIYDPETGNIQFRAEEKYPNGTVMGSYGYMDPRGRSRRVDYVADKNGYRILNKTPLRENYVELSTKKDLTATEASVSWTRPRKPNKKKTENILKTSTESFLPPYKMDRG